jgi:hypothetical protein
MAETPCDDTQNHASEALSLLYLSTNIIDRTYEHSVGRERPSVGVFQHYQQPLMQNAVECNGTSATNAFNEAISTNNISQISVHSTLQPIGNMLQQSNMFNCSTTAADSNITSSLPSACGRDPPMDYPDISTASPSTSSNNCPMLEVDIQAAPLAPSPITTMSDSTQNNSNSMQQPMLATMVSVTRTPFQTTINGTHLSVPVESEMRQFNCFDEEAHDAGYDSDGQLGPFFDAVADEVPFDEYEEEEPGIIMASPPPVENNQAEAPPILLSDSEIRKMKVSELRDELKKEICQQTV